VRQGGQYPDLRLPVLWLLRVVLLLGILILLLSILVLLLGVLVFLLVAVGLGRFLFHIRRRSRRRRHPFMALGRMGVARLIEGRLEGGGRHRMRAVPVVRRERPGMPAVRIVAVMFQAARGANRLLVNVDARPLAMENGEPGATVRACRRVLS